jgi:hypothetical protein
LAAEIGGPSLCGQRNMASIIGAGIMDRYPIFASALWKRVMAGCRRGSIGSKNTPSFVPKRCRRQGNDSRLRHRRALLSKHRSLRRRAITQSVIDLLGPDILMFGSDYPHGESWFPVAVENVLGWKLQGRRQAKNLLGQRLKYYRR